MRWAICAYLLRHWSWTLRNSLDCLMASALEASCTLSDTVGGMMHTELLLTMGRATTISSSKLSKSSTSCRATHFIDREEIQTWPKDAFPGRTGDLISIQPVAGRTPSAPSTAVVCWVNLRFCARRWCCLLWPRRWIYRGLPSAGRRGRPENRNSVEIDSESRHPLAFNWLQLIAAQCLFS